MKTLFLNPPFLPRFSRESRSPAVTKSNTLYYPKWLATAAGVALKEGNTVDLIDSPAQNNSVNYVMDRIENKGIEVVICDTSTPSIINDLKVIEQIKVKFPKLKVCLVGRHVSVLPEETFTMAPFIDYIAVREYDYTIRDLLKALDAGSMLDSVDGLVFKRNNDLIFNKTREPVENLDELPFVTEIYKRFLNIKDYFYGHSLYPLVVFDTSRGCPFNCNFCAYPQTFSGHKLRFRSIENVADEFEYVAKELPKIRNIMLEDDTFIVNKQRTLKLAEELIKRNNKIPFNANCRADIGGEFELLSKLKKAGARVFCVGFESGNDEVLKKINKNLNLAETRKFVGTCKQVGIMVHGCFMVGNLNETKDTMLETLKLAKELRPDTVQFYPIMVYPGTKTYNEAKEKGYLITEDFTKWLTEDGLHNSVINLPNITYRELVEFCDYARKSYYMNPRYIAHKVVQSVRHPSEFVRNFKGFTTLFKYLIKGSYTNKSQSSDRVC